MSPAAARSAPLSGGGGAVLLGAAAILFATALLCQNGLPEVVIWRQGASSGAQPPPLGGASVPPPPPSTASSPPGGAFVLSLPPSTTSVKINIGPNFDPPFKCSPPPSTEVCIYLDIQWAVIDRIRRGSKGNPNMIPFHAGIAGVPGLAKFRIMGGRHGRSTSLSQPGHTDTWNVRDNGTDFAPLMRLESVLAAVPTSTPITYLLTDMQGHDFAGIRSAGDAIRRVHRLTAEVYTQGKATYANVSNDYDRDWAPYMASLGWKEVGCRRAFRSRYASEADCTWVNPSP